MKNIMMNFFVVLASMVTLVAITTVMPVYGSPFYQVTWEGTDGSTFDNRPLLLLADASVMLPNRRLLSTFDTDVTVIFYRNDVEIGRTVTRRTYCGFNVRADFRVRAGFYPGEFSARIDSDDGFFPTYRVPIYLQDYGMSVRGYVCLFIYSVCPELDIYDYDPGNDIGLVVDGVQKEIAANPIIHLGRLMLPLFHISELFDADVLVNICETVRTTVYEVYKDGKSAEIGQISIFHPRQISHSSRIRTDENSRRVWHILERRPFYIEDELFVPASFISLFFNVDILWDEYYRNVQIKPQT